MADSTRRDILTGAAVVVTGSALASPTPAQSESFRIEPSARFMEIRHLQKRLAEMETSSPSDEAAYAEVWNQIIAIQSGISSRPQTPSELLDYATIMLMWNTAVIDGGLDPCEALMRTRRHRSRSHLPEQTAVDLAAAVFALAGYRADSFVPWARLCADPDL